MGWMNRIASVLEGAEQGFTAGIQLGTVGGERARADARDLRAEKSAIENQVTELANVGQYTAAIELANESNMPYLVDKVQGIRDTAASGYITKAGSPQFDPKGNVTRGKTIDFANIESIGTGLAGARADQEKLEQLSDRFGSMDYKPPAAPSFEPSPTTTTPTDPSVVVDDAPPTFFEEMVNRTKTSLETGLERIPKIKELQDQLTNVINVNNIDGIKGANIELEKYKALLISGGLDEVDAQKVIGRVYKSLQKTNDEMFLSMIQMPNVLNNEEAVSLFIEKLNPSPQVLKTIQPILDEAKFAAQDNKAELANNWLRGTLIKAGEADGNINIVDDLYSTLPQYVTNNASKEMIDKYKALAMEAVNEGRLKNLEKIRNNVNEKWKTDITNYTVLTGEGATPEQLKKVLDFPDFARSLGIKDFISDDPNNWPISLREAVVRARSGLEPDPQIRKDLRKESTLVSIDEATDKIIELGTGRRTKRRGGVTVVAKPNEVLKIFEELRDFASKIPATAEEEALYGKGYTSNIEADIYQALFDKGYQMLPDGTIFSINDPEQVKMADEKLSQIYGGDTKKITEYKNAVVANRAGSTKAKKAQRSGEIHWSDTEPTGNPLQSYPAQQLGKAAIGLGTILGYIPKEISEYTAKEGEQEARRLTEQLRGR